VLECDKEKILFMAVNVPVKQASESLHKGSNVLFISSFVADEKMMSI